MGRQEIDELGERFRGYAEGFLCGEEEFDRSIRLKIEHSFRVRSEAATLAAAEDFSPTAARLTDLAAMLHDFGRFEQFRRFRTFHDAVSVDHGQLGARLLVEKRFPTGRTPAERGIVLAAVRRHNALALPPGLGGTARQVAAAVRDADKLDILPILLDYLGHPANRAVVWNLADSTELTPAVRERLLRKESPFYRDFRNAADFVASKLGWVYDLNYDHSRAEFARRDYLGRLRRYLPDTAEIAEIFELASKELESRGKR